MDNNSPIISSIHNARIKLARKLRDSKTRRSEAKFLVDGTKEIREAAEAGYSVECIFHSSECSDVLPVPASDGSLQPVTPEVLARISYGQRRDSAVAVVNTPELPLAELDINTSSIILVLDRTEKPGNLGACLRSASACGVDAVVLTSPICELFNPNTIRASRGAVFTLPIAIAQSAEAIDAFKRAQISVFAARVDAQRQLWDCSFRTGCAVVFGNEAEGLGDQWHRSDVQGYRIPMNQSTDSLNVSISAAVTLYEVVRQRTGGN